MLPGMVQMKVRVVAAGVVADPRVTVDMGSVGVAFLVAEVAVFLRRMRRAMERTGTMGRRRGVTAGVLRKCGDGQHQHCRQSKLKLSHRLPPDAQQGGADPAAFPCLLGSSTYVGCNPRPTRKLRFGEFS